MEKILVIDDEPEVRNLIVKILERAGYESLEASDGDEGLRLFEKFSPSVIITDIVMPHKDGIELIMDVSNVAATADTSSTRETMVNVNLGAEALSR